MSRSPAAFAPRAVLVGAFIVSAMPTVRANGVTVVDNPALPMFTSLQAAIDAAPGGGLLLVQSGTYQASVIDGKSLSIVEVPGAQAIVNGPMTVRNLARGQTVLVTGLDVHGGAYAVQSYAPGMTLTNNEGMVRLESCTFTGGNYSITSSTAQGGPGLLVQACTQVALASCNLNGGAAWIEYGYPGTPGGPGLSSTNSNVVLYDCQLRGGTGGQIGWPGGDGGVGCVVTGWGLFASGSTISGGTGGDGDYVGCPEGGFGGDGMHVTGAQVWMLDTTLNPGFGGYSLCSTYQLPGVALQNMGGIVHQISGTRRKLAAAAISAGSALLTVTVTAQPGDRFYLMQSWDTAYAFSAALNGVWMMPPFSTAIARAIVPPSGTLVLQVRAPDLMMLTHRLDTLQGFCVDSSGHSTLTGPVEVEYVQ